MKLEVGTIYKSPRYSRAFRVLSVVEAAHPGLDTVYEIDIEWFDEDTQTVDRDFMSVLASEFSDWKVL